MLGLKDYGFCIGESNIRNKVINGYYGGYDDLKLIIYLML